MALKRFWKTVIHPKVEYMSFEKIQEIILEDDIWAKKEVNDLYAQMEELGNYYLMKRNLQPFPRTRHRHRED